MKNELLGYTASQIESEEHTVYGINGNEEGSDDEEIDNRNLLNGSRSMDFENLGS